MKDIASQAPGRPPNHALLRLGCALLVSAAFMACGVRTRHVYRAETQRAVATLSLLTDQAEAVRPLSAIAGRFHEAHRELEIQISLLTGESSFFTLLSTKFAVGDSPDIMISQPSSNVALYARGGYLMDLTGVASAKASEARGLESARFTFGGNRAYALPLEIESSGLLTNLDLLRGYGLAEPPRTFPEFLAECRLLQSRGLAHPLVLAGSDGIELLQFLKQYMVENLYARDPSFDAGLISGRRSWDAAPIYAAFDAFSKIKRCANPDALQIGKNEALHRFAHGAAAFAIEQSNVFPFIHRIAPNVTARLVAPPWRNRAVSAKDFLGIGSIAYASDLTRRTNPVRDFLRFLASPSVDRSYSREIGGVPLGGASGGASSLTSGFTSAGGWDPGLGWLPGLDIDFGHLVQDWYAGRGTKSVLAALQRTQLRLARANPDFSREILAHSE